MLLPSCYEKTYTLVTVIHNCRYPLVYLIFSHQILTLSVYVALILHKCQKPRDASIKLVPFPVQLLPFNHITIKNGQCKYIYL